MMTIAGDNEPPPFPISIGTGRNLGEAKLLSITWPDLVAQLSVHKQSDTKGGPFFIGGYFNGEDRQAVNMVGRTLLTIDIDETQITLKQLEQTIDASFPFTFCCYSTFSHSIDCPKIRIVAPLSREISQLEYRRMSRAVGSKLKGIKLDPCSYVPNQVMYSPRCPNKSKAWTMYRDGEWLNPDEYLDDDLVFENFDSLDIAIANKPLDLPQERINKILTDYQNDDLDYHDWLNVGFALHHEFEGNVQGLKLWIEWSSSSKKHNENENKKEWSNFNRKNNKPASPMTMATLIQRVSKKGGAMAALADRIGEIPKDKIKVNNTGIDRFVMNNLLQEMELKALDDVFVLDGLAVLGEWTVLYAAPNTGKTLITLRMLSDSAQAGVIKGSAVYYANCDDSAKGVRTKIRLANRTGINMLTPGYNDFTPTALMDEMLNMINSDVATGKIVVLDTLKKFTDTMDKKDSSDFGRIARAFVAKGGTLICLAHTNKHKIDGRSIHSGTSDIKDDSDCVYIIEHVGQMDMTDGTTKHSVEFVNDKARADVEQKMAFTYLKQKGMEYDQIFDSVSRGDGEDIIMAKKHKMRAKHEDEDQPALDSIKKALSDKEISKTELKQIMAIDSGFGHKKCVKIIDRWTASIQEGGLLYQRDEGVKKMIGLNGSFYHPDDDLDPFDDGIPF